MFVTIAFGSGGNLYFSNRNRYTFYAQCQTFWKHKLAIMHFLNFIFLFSSPNNLLIGCSLRDMDVLRTEGFLVRRYTRDHSSSNWIKWFAAHSFCRVNWGRRRRRRARAQRSDMDRWKKIEAEDPSRRYLPVKGGGYLSRSPAEFIGY